MDARQAEASKAEFISIFKEHIHRAGSDKLLDYLQKPENDFFTAPASSSFHGAFEGGLCAHSLNVYRCMKDFLARPRCKDVYGMPDYSEESIAVCALLHDICKMNFYTVDYRNRKNEQGAWERVPFYKVADRLPYGHGEKSVFMIQFFMHLKREEAMAIRWHMGFSGPEDARTVGQALEEYPIAFALHVADMEATYFIEGKGH